MVLVIQTGYAWDGPSGPTLDTPDTMRASLVHDALYQWNREQGTERATYPQFRKLADQEFLRLLAEDGVGFVRRWIWYWAVRWRGRAANVARERRRFPLSESE